MRMVHCSMESHMVQWQWSMVHRPHGNGAHAQGKLYRAWYAGTQGMVHRPVVHGALGMEHRAWGMLYRAWCMCRVAQPMVHRACCMMHDAQDILTPLHCLQNLRCSPSSSLPINASEIRDIITPYYYLWNQIHLPPPLHCLWNQRHQVSLFSETHLWFHRRVSDFRGLLILNFRKLLRFLLTEEIWN